MPKIVVIEQCV